MDQAPQNFESFSAQRAKDIALVFNEEGIDYLFIGKSGAIILGYPGTTQDANLFLPKNRKNAERVIRALKRLNFKLDEVLKTAILVGKDFIQITTGPFKLDLIHAPDGIKNYSFAKARAVQQDEFPVANLRDIIASKRASGRAKDLVDLYLLESFATEYDRVHPKPLATAVEKMRSSSVKRK